MRYIPHRLLLVAMLLPGLTPAWAQMHKVAKPEQVVRAIGVYEWTGDFAKPNASRLIPVSLFIDGKLEDAGIYVARPVPFALLSGNVYELQAAGIDKGYLDLVYARHMQAVEATGDLAYDDGWFGYGSVKPLAAPRKTAALKPSKNLPVLVASGGNASHNSDAKTTTTDSSDTNNPDRPTMKRRSSGTSNTPDTSNPTPASTTTSTASTPSTSTPPTDDPDRPTMKRRSDSSDGSATNSTTGSTPADDPDRPTMKRKSDSSDTTASNPPADDPDRPTMTRRTSTTSTTSDTKDTSTTDTGSSTASASTPSNDPDRPTLKRHSAEDAKRAHDTNSVTATGSLNDDPNRPNLHHGKPTSAMTEEDLPKLVGIPQNLHQMVAVSDAANRDPHAFTLDWDDAAQHAAILEKMQTMARAQLAAYSSTSAAKPAAPTVKKTTTTAHPHRTTKTAPPLVLLSDEELKAYTLSYGGAATYVYSAHTAGTGAALRYVTIVAQDNGLGEIKPAIQNVTDAAHLDRTPLMRFVDVVDVEASNRASLLFELRGQNARQFGLYRVIASHSEQIFLTGTTQ